MDQLLPNQRRSVVETGRESRFSEYPESQNRCQSSSASPSCWSERCEVSSEGRTFALSELEQQTDGGPVRS